MDKSPVLSYIRSRGIYAGMEAVGQVFIERRDENEKQYWSVLLEVGPINLSLTRLTRWPGIRAGDIVRIFQCPLSHFG